MKKNAKELFRSVQTFVFDVDGVFTDSTLLITSEGDLLRKMNVRDGYAVKIALSCGYRICIISGGSNEGVTKRLASLGITDIFLGVDDKLSVLTEYLKTNALEARGVLYMGDDIPDIPAMEAAGMVCCPQDSVPEVKAMSDYISHIKGGEGCVRDIIEQVLKVQGNWHRHFNAAQD